MMIKEFQLKGGRARNVPSRRQSLALSHYYISGVFVVVFPSVCRQHGLYKLRYGIIISFILIIVKLYQPKQQQQ